MFASKKNQLIGCKPGEVRKLLFKYDGTGRVAMNKDKPDIKASCGCIHGLSFANNLLKGSIKVNSSKGRVSSYSKSYLIWITMVEKEKEIKYTLQVECNVSL